MRKARDISWGYSKNKAAYMSFPPLRQDRNSESQMYKKLVAMLSHYCREGEDAADTLKRLLDHVDASPNPPRKWVSKLDISDA